MHFSKILVTTDLSEASFKAFDPLARDDEKEEIRLLYVYQYFQPAISSRDLPTPLVGAEAFEKTRKEIQRNLEAAAETYLPGRNVISEAVLSLNSPGDAICRYAAEHGSEVILIASAGQSAVKTLFIGSTVQRLLLHATCPVMVVPVRA